jgi:hypothetical protein
VTSTAHKEQSEKEAQVNTVLDAFMHMGATEAQLLEEQERLTTNEEYLLFWLEIVCLPRK